MNQSVWLELEKNIAVYKACADSNSDGCIKIGDEHRTEKAAILPENVLDNKIATDLLREILPNIPQELYSLFVTFISDIVKYEFSKQPSVGTSFDARYIQTTKNDLDLLRDHVMLDQHLLNAVQACNEYCNLKQIEGNVYYGGLIVVLLHDFGKSDYIKKKYADGSSRHEHISANYAKIKIKSYLRSNTAAKRIFSSALVNLIYTTLYEHHKNIAKDEDNNNSTKNSEKSPPKAKVQDSIYREILINSDITARYIELSSLGSEPERMNLDS